MQLKRDRDPGQYYYTGLQRKWSELTCSKVLELSGVGELGLYYAYWETVKDIQWMNRK